MVCSQAGRRGEGSSPLHPLLPTAGTAPSPAAGSRCPTPSRARSSPSSSSRTTQATRSATSAPAWTPSSGPPRPAPPGTPSRPASTSPTCPTPIPPPRPHGPLGAPAPSAGPLGRAAGTPPSGRCPPPICPNRHPAGQTRRWGVPASKAGAPRGAFRLSPAPYSSKPLSRRPSPAPKRAHDHGRRTVLPRFLRTCCYRLGVAAGQRRIPRCIQPAWHPLSAPHGTPLASREATTRENAP